MKALSAMFSQNSSVGNLPVRFVKNAHILIWKARRRWMAFLTRTLNPSVQFGERLLIDGYRPKIFAEGEFISGAGLYFQSPTRASEIRIGPRASLLLGDDVFLNDGVFIEARMRVEIGAHCLVAHNAAIMDTNFHQVDEESQPRSAPVIIEDNVWIGRNAVILPGIHVGRNSVIAANSVVTRSVPANSLAAGVPAVIKRQIRSSAHFIRR